MTIKSYIDSDGNAATFDPTSSLKMSEIKAEFTGDSNPSLGEYFRGGSRVKVGRYELDYEDTWYEGNLGTNTANWARVRSVTTANHLEVLYNESDLGSKISTATEFEVSPGGSFVHNGWVYEVDSVVITTSGGASYYRIRRRRDTNIYIPDKSDANGISFSDFYGAKKVDGSGNLTVRERYSIFELEYKDKEYENFDVIRAISNNADFKAITGDVGAVSIKFINVTFWSIDTAVAAFTLNSNYSARSEWQTIEMNFQFIGCNFHGAGGDGGTVTDTAYSPASRRGGDGGHAIYIDHPFEYCAIDFREAVDGDNLSSNKQKENQIGGGGGGGGAGLFSSGSGNQLVRMGCGGGGGAGHGRGGGSLWDVKGSTHNIPANAKIESINAKPSGREKALWYQTDSFKYDAYNDRSDYQDVQIFTNVLSLSGGCGGGWITDYDVGGDREFSQDSQGKSPYRTNHQHVLGEQDRGNDSSCFTCWKSVTELSESYTTVTIKGNIIYNQGRWTKYTVTSSDGRITASSLQDYGSYATGGTGGSAGRYSRHHGVRWTEKAIPGFFNTEQSAFSLAYVQSGAPGGNSFSTQSWVKGIQTFFSTATSSGKRFGGDGQVAGKSGENGQAIGAGGGGGGFGGTGGRGLGANSNENSDGGNPGKALFINYDYQAAYAAHVAANGPFYQWPYVDPVKGTIPNTDRGIQVEKDGNKVYGVNDGQYYTSRSR